MKFSSYLPLLLISLLTVYLYSQDEQIFFKSCINGNLEIVKKFVEDGGNIEMKDKTGATGLIFASAHNRNKVVKFLIENGADPNAKDNNGWTALISAAQLGNDYTETARLLIDNGADLNCTDGDGFTALHIALENGYKNLAELLIYRGADLNKKTKLDHETPLHKAAKNGYIDIVRLLVEKKSRLEEKNISGLTALELAKEEGQNEVVVYLKSISKFVVPRKR